MSEFYQGTYYNLGTLNVGNVRALVRLPGCVVFHEPFMSAYVEPLCSPLPLEFIG